MRYSLLPNNDMGEPCNYLMVIRYAIFKVANETVLIVIFK